MGSKSAVSPEGKDHDSSGLESLWVGSLL